MDAQDFRSLQESYKEVYSNELYEATRMSKELGREGEIKIRKKLTKPGLPKVENPPIALGDRHLRLVRLRAKQNESYDLYDIILSHLLDEGYAETPEAAEVIMVNMSEDWREYIIEAEREFPLRKVADKINQVSRKIESSKSPEEISKLRNRMDKMNDEYWLPN